MFVFNNFFLCFLSLVTALEHLEKMKFVDCPAGYLSYQDNRLIAPSSEPGSSEGDEGTIAQADPKGDSA